jgi:hypothetical protein
VPSFQHHALSCKKGGLVLLCRNEICDELGDLASKGLIPSAVRDEPRIYPCRSAPGTESLSAAALDAHGNLLVRGLFTRSTDCIIDVQVSDLDAPSYCNWSADKLLSLLEKAKKSCYLKACLAQH